MIGRSPIVFKVILSNFLMVFGISLVNTKGSPWREVYFELLLAAVRAIEAEIFNF